MDVEFIRDRLVFGYAYDTVDSEAEPFGESKLMPRGVGFGIFENIVTHGFTV